MKYVVDASVALKWLVVEADSDKARELRDGYRQGIHELLAPELFSAEVANVLLMNERKGRLPTGDGAIHLADLLTTLPRLRPARTRMLRRAYAIAEQISQTVYDCLYVALAESEACEMVTADEKLVVAAEVDYPFVRPLASMP
jgi:predicted nucleic acid-binding protein